MANNEVANLLDIAEHYDDPAKIILNKSYQLAQQQVKY
jgi:hypothetical protein